VLANCNKLLEIQKKIMHAYGQFSFRVAGLSFLKGKKMKRILLFGLFLFSGGISLASLDKIKEEEKEEVFELEQKGLQKITERALLIKKDVEELKGSLISFLKREDSPVDKLKSQDIVEEVVRLSLHAEVLSNLVSACCVSEKLSESIVEKKE